MGISMMNTNVTKLNFSSHVRAKSRSSYTTNRSGDGRLNILWVKIGGLWPLTSGGRLRSFHLINALSKRHNITIVTTHSSEEDPADLQQQLPSCNIVSREYRPAKKNSARFLFSLSQSLFSPLPVDLYKNRLPALRDEVKQLLKTSDFDACVADFLVAMPNLPPNLNIPLLFFEHNVEYMIWKRLEKTHSNIIARSLLALEWRKMRRYEIQSCKRADTTITVSQDDKALLSQDVSDRRIVPISTGVDVDFFQPDASTVEAPFELVFTGSMDWHPNEDAMFYFIDAIWPLIRQDIPNATMTMVGRNPSSKLRSCAESASIRITGTVDDVRPFIAKAALYVVPLRIGGGTRLKIYEALAMGKAVVSTTIGAEGLPLVEGQHILRADDATSFAKTAVNLLRDQRARDNLAAEGRRLMVEKYSWDKVGLDFEKPIHDLVDQRSQYHSISPLPH